MLDLEFDTVKQNPIIGLHKNMSNHVYHSQPGISNSGLCLVEKNPALYKHNQDAPKDFKKTGAQDVGTAVHTGILEPDKFHNILVAPVKGRETQKFSDFAEQNNNNLCLVESEYNKVKLMVDSVRAHPLAKKFLNTAGDCESSIFVEHTDHKVICKIRPDKDLTKSGLPLLLDVKKTKSINDWRDNKHWKNPLFTLNYGHNAAFYLEIASIHYKKQYDEYCFLLVQDTIELGVYPVTVFSITRDELEDLGFFKKVHDNLKTYAECLNSNSWDQVERFPTFNY